MRLVARLLENWPLSTGLAAWLVALALYMAASARDRVPPSAAAPAPIVPERPAPSLDVVLTLTPEEAGRLAADPEALGRLRRDVRRVCSALDEARATVSVGPDLLPPLDPGEQLDTGVVSPPEEPFSTLSPPERAAQVSVLVP